MSARNAIGYAVKMLAVGFVLITAGFVAVLAGLLAQFRPVELVVGCGLFVMVAGVLTCLLGLAKLVFRRPTSAELAGASSEEVRSWHFTRFGLSYFLFLMFGVPSTAMVVDQVWPDASGLTISIAVAAYGLALMAVVVPAVSRYFFHMPAANIENRAELATAVTPEPVLDYIPPLFGLSFTGLLALGLVVAISADGPDSMRSGLGGVIIGMVGLVVCLVPRWRRRLLRPRRWRG